MGWGGVVLAWMQGSGVGWGGVGLAARHACGLVQQGGVGLGSIIVRVC